MSSMESLVSIRIVTAAQQQADLTLLRATPRVSHGQFIYPPIRAVMPVLLTDGEVKAYTGERSFLRNSSGIEPRWVGGLFLGHILRTA